MIKYRTGLAIMEGMYRLLIVVILVLLGVGVVTESDRISKKLDAVCGPVAEQPQPTR